MDSKVGLQKRIEEIDKEITDLRRMGNLQIEMTMLAMKLIPAENRPLEYTLGSAWRVMALDDEGDKSDLVSI